MLLIPAIDIKEGKCVRLRQGDMDDPTVFSNDPLAMADRWVKEGARRLHIVDLDGAIKGSPVNTDIIHQISEHYPDLPIQVGGGIRSAETIDIYVQSGVRYVIIGTQAINEPHFISDLCAEFPSRIIVSLDAREGKVFTDGWSKLSKHDAIDMAQQFDEYGVESIIYTDIARDGMMQGVNIEATVKLAESINIPVIASGGIHNIENLKLLAAKNDSGIVGAITGRAIYEGKLDFSEGQKLLDKIANSTVFGL